MIKKIKNKKEKEVLTLINFMRWVKLHNKENKLLREKIKTLEEAQILLLKNISNETIEFKDNYSKFYIG